MTLEAVEARSEGAARFGTEQWRRTVAAASPALIHGLRLTASVCLALFIAYSLQLNEAHWAGTSASTVTQPALGASIRSIRKVKQVLQYRVAKALYFRGLSKPLLARNNVGPLSVCPRCRNCSF